MVRARGAERHSQATDLLASDVGERIRKARHERGMTLAALGGDDLSRSFLSAVEAGRSRLSLQTLLIVARRLNLPVSYFLEDQAETPGSTAELMLNQAEALIDQTHPDHSLQLLQDLDVPATMQVRLYSLRGRAYMRLGQAAEAVRAMQPGLELLETEEDRHAAAEFRQGFGAALYATGNYIEATLHLRRALDDALSGFEDAALIGRITATLGHVAFMQGDAGQAQAHYERAVQMFGKVRDYYTQACIYSGLSSAYHRQGKAQEALRYSRLSIGAFQASNSLRQMTDQMNNIAIRYQELGDLDQALASAQEAVERAEGLGAADLQARAHRTLATVYLKRHDLDAAEREAELVDAIEQDGTSQAQIEAWKVRADIAQERGDDDLADQLYARVLEALKETPDQGLYAATALAYGELLRRRGDTTRALDLAFEVARMRLGITAAG